MKNNIIQISRHKKIYIVFCFLISLLVSDLAMFLFYKFYYKMNFNLIEFNISYEKYIVNFFNNYSGISWLPLPLSLIGFLIIFILMCVCLMRLLNFDGSYPRLAKFSDLKHFKNPTPTVTSKTGIVLGVMNRGLIPHDKLLNIIYGDYNFILKGVAKFIFFWRKIPILNIFVKYTILKTNAPLATLCVAPAGTGKTAGIVLPSIISCDEDNLIINDPKGEIYDLTHKYREKLGKVFRFEWKNATFSNKWNILDYKMIKVFFDNQDATGISFSSQIADLAINIADVLIKDSGGDKFWTESAKSMLSTITQYAIYNAFEEEQSTNIAEIKQIIDNLSVPATTEELEHHENSVATKKASPSNEMVMFKLINMIHFLENLENKYPNITTTTNILSANLAKIAGTPEQTRGSIIATLSTSLRIFDNENVVKNINSSDDFDMIYLREGYDNKPITVYLIVPASEQESYGAISGLFVQLSTNYLIALRNPLKTDKTVRFILDEVAFFPSISAVKDAPAITRSYKVSYMYICQDIGQLKEKWGEHGFNNIKTNTAFKIILALNNDETARLFSNMIGKTKSIITKGRGEHKEKQEIEYDLYTSNDLGSLVNKQVVLVQNKMNRPLELSQPFWFKYEEFYKKINKKG